MEYRDCGLPFAPGLRTVNLWIADEIKEHQVGRDLISIVQEVRVGETVCILVGADPI